MYAAMFLRSLKASSSKIKHRQDLLSSINLRACREKEGRCHARTYINIIFFIERKDGSRARYSSAC